MIADVTLLGLLHIKHSHTLCHIFLHIVLSHDSGTIALEALPRLETLALVFETSRDNEPEHGILRPFGRNPEAFRRLVCYQFQISSSCSDLECTRLLQFLARSRFPIIHTIIIEIPTTTEPRVTAVRLLAFFNVHHRYLRDVALAVVPALIPLLLPKIHVPSVCIAVHHHFTSIGRLVSSELQHFTLGPCHNSVPGAARPLVVLGFLSELYNHIRYHQQEHKLTTIKLYDLEFTSNPTYRSGIMIEQMADAFLEIGIIIRDAFGHSIVEVTSMSYESCHALTCNSDSGGFVSWSRPLAAALVVASTPPRRYYNTRGSTAITSDGLDVTFVKLSSPVVNGDMCSGVARDIPVLMARSPVRDERRRSRH
jgi:hypothetical protein